MAIKSILLCTKIQAIFGLKSCRLRKNVIYSLQSSTSRKGGTVRDEVPVKRSVFRLVKEEIAETLAGLYFLEGGPDDARASEDMIEKAFTTPQHPNLTAAFEYVDGISIEAVRSDFKGVTVPTLQWIEQRRSVTELIRARGDMPASTYKKLAQVEYEMWLAEAILTVISVAQSNELCIDYHDYS